MTAGTDTINNTAATKKTVDVTVTSDLMCPWCWIGLRKLQEASKTAQIDTNITWKPYLLRPGLPKEGIPKGGTPTSRVGARLKAAGEAVGLQFTGLTDRTPNTILLHATMQMLYETSAVEKAQVTDFQEAAFEAYFTLGIYPDEAGLLKCASKVGLSDMVSSFFKDNERMDVLSANVLEEAQAAPYKRGVSGVPSFEFGGVRAFSGAQPLDVFVYFLEKHAK